MPRTPKGAGAAIRAARLEAGWTQADLAGAVGCTQGRLSEYEAGKIAPSVEICGKIADALGLAFLYDGQRAAYVERS